MKEIEQQNELLLFRMKEINELVEKTIETSRTINENHEQQLNEKIMNLNDKVNQIQQSNELLADSFKHIIYQEMNAITHDLKRQNDEYLQESRRGFTKSVEEITKKADDLIDKQLQQE